MTERPLDEIHIRDLRLRCIIGLNPEERRHQQDVTISVTLYADLRQAGQSDQMADTVDYRAIKKEIVALVEPSAFLLVERLAERIAETALAHTGVEKVRVLVEKPGALRFARTVGIEIVRQRTT